MSASETSAANALPAPQFPAHWEADVVLRDGTPAHVRPILPRDRVALQEFHVAQSERSIYMRFFAAMERLSDRDLTRFTETDNVDRVAIVATTTRDGIEAIVGVARFDRIEEDEAEVAFNISDHIQGRGLGSVLLEHIAAAAREVGIRKFYAEVLPQNGRMLSVFREAGYSQAQHEDDGIVEVTVDLHPTEESIRVMAQREHHAESVSMKKLFSPRRILVVASLTDEPTPEEIRFAQGALASGIGVKGEEPVHVLGLSPVYIRDAQKSHGKADNFIHHTSLEALVSSGQTFDIAMLAVTDTAVAPLLTELAKLQVRGVVLLSAGFAESGEGGLTLQRDAIKIAHSAGIRIIGPASYGLFSNTAEEPFNASLTPQLPERGSTGLFGQSTAIAVSLLNTAIRRRIGLSNFLAAGNRADISGNDMMQFWLTDESTSAVGMYLESIGNPRKFSRIARRLSHRKPVVVVTAGKSGYVVPRGHAVVATNAPKKTLDQMLKQSGVIRARNTHEMGDVLQFFAHQPIPLGKRVGILASSESLAAIAGEAASSAGLDVTEHVYVVRSMDLGHSMQPALDALYEEGACDVVIVVHVPSLGEFPLEAAQRIAQTAADAGRPTVASILGLHGISPELTAVVEDVNGPRSVTVPAYSTPEDAIRALEHINDYATWLSEEGSSIVYFDGIDKYAVDDLIKELPDGPVSQAMTAQILERYGIKAWPSIRVYTLDEALEAANELGYPVALKSTVAAMRHRADLGGVRLNIANAEDFRHNFKDMTSEMEHHLGAQDYAAMHGFDIQSMAPTGVPCVVKSQEDPLYGSLVSFGLAGDAFDLLDDIAYGIPPLTENDVSKMVRSVGASQKLFGYNDLPPVDIEALEQLIARVSLLSDNHPSIKELELYPVILAQEGFAAVSARLVIGQAQRKDGLRRALNS